MVEAAAMRERLFTMRLSDEESARLDAVSKHYGLNAAGVIRMLVKREHDSLVRETVPRDDSPWGSFVEGTEKALQLASVRGLHLVLNPSKFTIQITDGSRGKIAESPPDAFEILRTWPKSKLGNYDYNPELLPYMKITKPRKR